MHVQNWWQSGAHGDRDRISSGNRIGHWYDEVIEKYSKGIYVTINCTNLIIPVANSIVIGLLYAVIAIIKDIMQHSVVLKKVQSAYF